MNIYPAGLMKTITISFAICVLAQLPICADPIWDTAPEVSRDEIVNFLKLNLEKYSVKFDHPTKVFLRYEGFGQNQDFHLSRPTKSATLLVYQPKKEETKDVGQMTFQLKGNGESASSYGSFEASKVVSTKTGVIDGVFQIVAYDNKELKEPFLYRFQILTKDN